MPHDFTSAALRVGVPFGYSLDRPRLAAYLLAVASRYAKAAKRKLRNTSHSKALEAVAACAGFADWHAMQTTCARVRGWTSGEKPSLEPFARAAPFLIRVSKDVPPRPEQSQGLREIAIALAQRLGAPVEEVLDVVAYVHEADSWVDLMSRDAAATKDPLYGIRLFPDGSWRFTESAACLELTDRQDAWFLEDGRSRADEASEGVQQLRALLVDQPDFLYGYLVLGAVHYEADDPDCLPVLAEGVRRAMALVDEYGPATLDWAYVENRFFHRLLYTFMKATEQFGDGLEAAVTAARTQMRLCPADNLGVRYHLPVLLYAHGKGTVRALSRLKKESRLPNVHPAFILGVIELASPETLRSGVEHLLYALFTTPALMDLLVNCEVLDARERPDRFRGAIPDLPAIWMDIRLLVRKKPAIVSVASWVFEDYRVKRADLQLGEIYARCQAARVPDSGVDLRPWKGAVANSARSLASEMAEPLAKEALKAGLWS